MKNLGNCLSKTLMHRLLQQTELLLRKKFFSPKFQEYSRHEYNNQCWLMSGQSWYPYHNHYSHTQKLLEDPTTEKKREQKYENNTKAGYTKSGVSINNNKLG